jgi:hypothetical protein
MPALDRPSAIAMRISGVLSGAKRKFDDDLGQPARRAGDVQAPVNDGNPRHESRQAAAAGRVRTAAAVVGDILDKRSGSL